MTICSPGGTNRATGWRRSARSPRTPDYGRVSLSRASETLRDSLGPVVDAASDMLDAFRALPVTPSEIEVEFGVSLDAGVGAVIAGGTAGVHLNVTLHWTPQTGNDA